MVYSLKQLETSYHVSKQLDLAQFIQHGSNSGIVFSKWNQSITRKSRDPPRRHICNICLRTFPQIRHRASSVFCLQRGVEYRPSDSFLFCLNRRLVGCWEQPPEQNFAMSVIYIWHVQQQPTAVQISDERGTTDEAVHTHTHWHEHVSPFCDVRIAKEPFDWTGSFYRFDRTDSQSLCESHDSKVATFFALKYIVPRIFQKIHKSVSLFIFIHL